MQKIANYAQNYAHAYGNCIIPLPLVDGITLTARLSTYLKHAVKCTLYKFVIDINAVLILVTVMSVSTIQHNFVRNLRRVLHLSVL